MFSKALSGVLLCVLVALPSQAGAWWIFGPDNYEECVQKYVKKTRTPQAASLATLACKSKFKDNYMGPYSEKAAECILGKIRDVRVHMAAVVLEKHCRCRYDDSFGPGGCPSDDVCECIINKIDEAGTPHWVSSVVKSCR